MCMVVGSNLGEPELNFKFSIYFWLWREYEKLRETLVEGQSLVVAEKQP